jgi:hypothetical protein
MELNVRAMKKVEGGLLQSSLYIEVTSVTAFAKVDGVNVGYILFGTANSSRSLSLRIASVTQHLESFRRCLDIFWVDSRMNEIHLGAVFFNTAANATNDDGANAETCALSD